LLPSDEVCIKLRSKQDEEIKVDFIVDFLSLELVAKDLRQLKPYDFETIFFKIDDMFFTTKPIFFKLLERSLITLNLNEIKTLTYRKNERESLVSF
jgi:hypothetical protein